MDALFTVLQNQVWIWGPLFVLVWTIVIVMYLWLPPHTPLDADEDRP